MLSIIKNNLFPIIFIVFFVFLTSCKKNTGGDNIPLPPGLISEPVTYRYTSDKPANLNIVYFIPTDMQAYTDYEKRISEVLLNGQDFYKREMERNGFGARTFGLLKDDNYKRVKIITLKARLSKSNYVYADASKAVAEINEYYTLNPSEKSSEHTLVILPSPLNADGTPVGVSQNPSLAVPFYGYGKWCFIKDFPAFSIASLSSSNSFVGGTHHELGHALGLPHNAAKQSEKATLGTALMGAGNSTYGMSPTFLTKADCAILSNNQIFNGAGVTYYTNATVSITSLKSDYSTQQQAIIVSGKISTSGSPLKNILFYNDANFKKSDGTYNDYGVNHDYESIAFLSQLIGPDSFYVEMPIAEYIYKDSVKYQLKVRMVHENGVINSTEYYYAFVNNVPVVDFGTKTPIDRTGWTVSASSEDPFNSFGVTGFVTNMLDNDINTIWIPLRPSNGGVLGGIYSFTVDMHRNEILKGIITTSRQNNNTQIIKLADVEISNDGLTWHRVVTEFEAPQSIAPVNISFGNAFNCRYFRVIIKSVWSSSAQNPAVAEINAYVN